MNNTSHAPSTSLDALRLRFAQLDSSRGKRAEAREVALVLRDHRIEIAGVDFETAFTRWLLGAQQILDKYMEKFSNVPKPTLVIDGELAWLLSRSQQRFIRVLRKEEGQVHGSAHAFIDIWTGDIRKPASFKTPAKHARGNLFEADGGLKFMGPHGPAYMR